MDVLRPSLLFGALAAVAMATATVARAQADQISLMAVRAGAGSGIRPEAESEVRLLWVPSQGWVPAVGVNVFRADKPGSPLNQTPIKLDDQMLSPEAQSHVKRPIVTARPLFGAGVNRGAVGTSSQTAFAAFKSTVERLKTTAGTRGAQIEAEAAKTPEVKSYRKSILVTPRTNAAAAATTAPPRPAAMTEDEKTISSRIQVLLAALTNYKAAQRLGLAYVDTTAQPRTTYTYILRSADPAGQELARAEVPAEDSGQPPAPAGLDGVQTGQTSVALHWEPVGEADHKKLVSTTYNVFRGTVRLNKSPMRIAYLPTTDGGHVASMANFIDHTAPLGPVTYNVTMTDVFGRVSPSASVIVTMADFRVPAHVAKIVAAASKTNPGAIRLFWVTPNPVQGDIVPDPGTSYDIYRAEAGQSANILTGGGPIRGAVLTSPTGANVGKSEPNADRLLGGAAGAETAPGDVKDLTVGDFLSLNPPFEAELLKAGLDMSHFNPALPGSGGVTGVNGKVLETLRAEPVETLYARLSAAQKEKFETVRQRVRSYLDTKIAIDKDYRYEVEPCYAVNPGHHGTGSLSAFIAVPNKAAPDSPTGLAGTFHLGQGTFGYVASGATPTLRSSGIVGAEIQKSTLEQKVASGKVVLPKSHPQGTGVQAGNGVRTGSNVKQQVGKGITTLDPSKVAGLLEEKAPPMTIGGRVQLTWQPVSFTSKVRYRIYRAAATGLFLGVQTASAAPPVGVPSMNTIAKIGSPLRASMKSVAQQRLNFNYQYYEDFPGVPAQNYVLLTETDQTTFTDVMPVSQRMHYLYRVIPQSRWGVQGAETPIVDVTIPATLSPAVPTLLRVQVDENQADGHVRLTIVPNPVDENVEKYLIFRKPVIDILRAAQRDVARVMVASSGKLAVGRRIAPLPPLAARNMSVRTMKADQGAVYKRIIDPTGYVQVGELPVTAPPTFTDMAGEPRTPYVYEIVAVNKDHIASRPSSPADGTAIKTHCDPPRSFTAALTSPQFGGTSAQRPGGPPADIVSRAAQKTTPADRIDISWQPPATERPTQYVLERSIQHTASGGTASRTVIGPDGRSVVIPGTPANVLARTSLTFITLASSLSPATLKYSDTSVRAGRVYTYRLRAIDAEGLFSEPLTANVTIPALAAATFADPSPTTESPSAAAVANAATPAAGTPTPNRPKAPTGAVGVPGVAAAVIPIGRPKAATNRGHFGETYFLIEGGQFAARVDDARFTTSGYAIDPKNYYYCRPAEKFLKVRLRVRNETDSPQEFTYQTVTASCVSADGEASPETKNWKALDTGTLANRTVTPGGEFEIEGVITTNAQGSPTTLNLSGCAFDLGDAANQVPALDAPPEAPATIGNSMPLALTTGAVTSAVHSGATYTVTLQVRNATLAPLTVGPANFVIDAIDQDGDKYVGKPKSTDLRTLAPGAESTLTFVYDVPAAVRIDKVTYREKDSRVYVITMGVN